MGKVAEKMPAALSTDAATAEPAVRAIAGEMQAFVAADVVYNRRTRGAHQAGARRQRDRRPDDPEPRASCRTSAGSTPSTVARRINADAGRGAGDGGIDRAAAPGPARPRPARRQRRRRHARRPARTPPTASRPSSNVTFNVKFANQGENTEADVARARSRSAAPASRSPSQKTVDQTRPGPRRPSRSRSARRRRSASAVKITVEVRKVAGEKNTTNNKAEYPAIFRRG